MKKIYEALDPATVHVLRSALEAREIPCEVRSPHRYAAMGEVPPIECWTELWLVDDAQEARARQILAETGSTPATDWTCDGCGESVEGTFGECWNCGEPREPASGSGS